MIADLATLRAYVGAVSTKDDALLTDRLAVARRHVERRISPDYVGDDDAEEAVLLVASRLYKRRQSPEGAAGFSGEGFVVRILSTDPDVRALMERLQDLSTNLETGIGIG